MIVLLSIITGILSIGLIYAFYKIHELTVSLNHLKLKHSKLVSNVSKLRNGLDKTFKILAETKRIDLSDLKTSILNKFKTFQNDTQSAITDLVEDTDARIKKIEK